MSNYTQHRRWAPRILAGLAALTIGTTGAVTATAAQAAEQQVTGLQLDWGYSSYAQYGVFGPWAMEAAGDGVSIATVPEAEVAGAVPGASSKDYRIASFADGAGSLDPETGAGTITWPDAGTLTVNPVRMMGGPDLFFSAPILEVAADGTAALSFDVGAGAGASMGGAPSPAQDPVRTTVLTLTDTHIADGELTGTPVFAGQHYRNAEGVQQTQEAGGSWLQSYIDQLPDAVRAFHYMTGTSTLNQQKAPLPFQVIGDLPEGPATGAAPQIELFAADGQTPLGTTTVNPGDEIVVRGSGFDPEANNPGGDGSGLPIPNNQPQGTFVAFGAVGSPWKPSEQAPSENRTQVRANTKWVLLESVIAAMPAPLQATMRAQAIILDPATGTFEGRITAATPSEIPANGQFGVYSYAGGAANATNPAQELFIPVTYSDAPTPGEGGETETPVTGELVWGFKKSWRDYVANVAQGATHHSGHATIDEAGLFHFPLAAGSTYDPATGTGVLKYEGRIRFQSALHEFDIVLQNPHVTITAPSAPGILSAELSTTTTVGDLTVSRVDVARIALTEPTVVSSAIGSVSAVPADPSGPGAAPAGDATYRASWTAQATTILDTIQPTELHDFYAGQAGDPVSFGTSQVETVPGTDPGTDTDPATDPATDPGTGTDPATDPATDPGTSTDPGTGTDPSTGGTGAPKPDTAGSTGDAGTASVEGLARTGADPAQGALLGAAALLLVGGAALALARARSSRAARAAAASIPSE